MTPGCCQSGPQGHDWQDLCRVLLNIVTYYIYRLKALWSQRRSLFHVISKPLADNDAPLGMANLEPREWLAGFIKGITKHYYTQYILTDFRTATHRFNLNIFWIEISIFMDLSALYSYIISVYLHLPMTSLQGTLIEQLSSFADKDICPRGKRSLATSRINEPQNLSTLCSIDVTSLRRLLNVMAEHIDK